MQLPTVALADSVSTVSARCGNNFPHHAETVSAACETVSAVCGKRSRCLRKPIPQYAGSVPARCGYFARTLRFPLAAEPFPRHAGIVSAGCAAGTITAVCGPAVECTSRPPYPQAADTIPAVCGPAAECTSRPPYCGAFPAACGNCFRRVRIQFPQCADPLRNVLLGHRSYAMEPEHSNPPRVLARERKRRQRANASAESLSTPASQSGNETTPAAARPDSTATDLREAFYCAFLRNTSTLESPAG